MLSREQLEGCANCDNRCTFPVNGEELCNMHDTGFSKKDCIKQIAQTALELMDQVEAQQKEIEQLKTDNKIYKKVQNKAIEALAENHKLKDTTAVLNNSYINSQMNLEHMTELYEQLNLQNGGLLEDITHLHTIVIPEYIGTLKKAKEALEMSWDETINWVEAQEKAMQTLESIDKAIGGGQ